MTPLQQRLCNLLQRGVPICERPFLQMAERLGTTESAVLEAIHQIQDLGVLRRIGPIVDPRALGKVTTLVTSHVPDPPLRQVVEAVNRLPGVSHNYLRRHYYNLWFTLQGDRPADIDRTLAQVGDPWGLEFHSLPARLTFKLEVYFDATGREPARSPASEAPSPRPAQLTESERAVLAGLQQGLTITARPFDSLDQCAGSPGQIIALVDSLIQKGAVRRVAGVMDHRALGFTANALLVAEVRHDQMTQAGRALATRAEVSHCYQRDPFPGWPYTLYAMLHGRSIQDIHKIADAFSQSERAPNVLLLETAEELKKRPVVHCLDQKR
jgi:siroheme decarboxylase